MFLSDTDIRECIKAGKIAILPAVDDISIRTAGIRVHLDNKILIPKPGQTIDLQNPTSLEYDEHFLKNKPYTLLPGQFVLTSTIERIQLDRSLLAFIDGRSTIARLGLTTHLSSTTIDGNYDEPRATTLEMGNIGNFNIILHYNDFIGMIVFAEMKTDVCQSPQKQYQGQDGVAPPSLSFKPTS